MSLSMSIAAMLLATTNFVSPEVAYFPGSFFEANAKTHLQQRAMDQWPGPSQIVDQWQSGDLDMPERMAILLGMSASHDPVLLPIYRQAVLSDNDRIRMAAAYGYRELLGDAAPNLADGVDIESARQLAGEMDAVARTLRERPLVEFWLQSVLMADGTSMPGWQGVVLNRPKGLGLRAVERVLGFEDLPYLATAYRRAQGRDTRVSLMRLLEAITLREFLVVPSDPRAGWGSKHINEALEAADEFVDYWIDVRCTTDSNTILAASMNAMGVRGVQPLAPESYEIWLRVLKEGSASWYMMAARQLYDLGGRWSQLSVLQADSPSQIAARDELIKWYRLLPAHILNRGNARPQPRP
jgi:hypothetical protein